ncbi:Delta(3,5)-Delta(2,4)-dienoyl-CoA isomerase, mitochondrial [Symbiodinium microadriaticum]|uniref:Delta(3,5)-Delta(2,4)-dienoyl-CoA isomerase, mitochondrial n=1 Tax=Symbiodinium microadriaticum TaxID=2951 RepID=A0A1Q9DFA3_SYMMI|nr:Delta(3,5)-Delta(2,4)-dienoyl-CoA isomerase, mitochondrial [Symbiodinium microadriaticum]
MAANRLEPFSRLTRLAVTEAAPHVLHVELQRPQKLNALDMAFWEEIRTCFEAIALDVDTRVVLLSGAGRCFCAGLDLGAAMAMFGGSSGAGQAESDVARKALRVRAMGKAWQASFTSLEACGKAVIGCMHGAVVGAGLEMITACDVRFCTEDAYFQAAEVDVGLAADVGGLQRLPKIIGNQSLVRELALSGRRMAAAEALQHGLVSRVCATKEAMLAEGLELAKTIAAKSPVATLGVKQFLNYARDHSVEESLDYAITWNMSMLQGSDMAVAAASMLQKSSPGFGNLPPPTPSKL